MARTSVVLLLALVPLTLASGSLSAQKPEPTPPTSGNYVRLDVYASRDGQPVDDLTRADVEVLEDGVPQALNTFEHIKIAESGTRDSGSGTRARVFVIFLDTYHTQIETSSNLRIPLIRFLDRVIAADDMVAIVTPEMSANEMTFVRKGAIISNIMQAEWAWARRGRTDRRDQKEELYDACYGSSAGRPAGPAPEMKARRRERMTLAALDELVAHISTLREERKAVLTISDGWVLFRENRTLNATPGGGRNRATPADVLRPRRPEPEDTGSQGVNRLECDADRTVLAALDHSNRLRELAENANRSNISFYTVDPRGIVPSDAQPSRETPSSGDREMARPASRQDSLRFLADNTDGLAVGSAAGVDAAIERIVNDVSSYYLVGYSSSNTKLDGRFRSIAVRATRDGVKVRTRRGYRGRTAEDILSGNDAASAAADKVSALGTGRTNARSPFRIRTSSWFPDSADGKRQGAFWVVGELNYQTRRQLAWTAGSEAEVVVLAADGTEIVSRTVEVKAGDGPFGIQVPENGTIAAGEYAVRVNLRSQADAKAEFSDTARVALNGSSSLGEAVLWRRGPSTGPQYMRTAEPRFSRADRLRLELPTSVKTPATARLLDRNGNEIAVPAQVSERADPSGAFGWVVVDAVLAPFTMGDYAVEVRQGEAKQITAFSIVP